MTTLARAWGLGLALIIVSVSVASAQTTAPATRQAGGKVVVIEFAGVVDEFAADAVQRNVKAAREAGATVIILEIDTYGGLVSAGLDITRFLKQQTDLHTIAFVKNKAISAGSLIAAACDEIVMQPHALIGDCGVISGTGESIAPTERAKFESPVVEDMRDSATRNHHPVALLEAMVVLDREAHYIQRGGERKIVGAADYKRLTGETPPWTAVEGVRDPLDSEQSLLTLSTDTALKIGFATEESATPETLAAGRGYVFVKRISPGVAEDFVRLLSSSAVRGLLVVALMLSLYFALHTPGHGLPEAAVMTSLALLLGVPLLTGYAAWWEILAVLAGIGLLAIEIFVLPGFGVAGITGLILLIGGLALTFVPPMSVPNVPGVIVPWRQILDGLATTLIAMVASLGLWFWLSRYLTKLPYFNRLVLQTTAGGVLAGVVETHADETWPAVGMIGVVATDLRPGGTARFPDPRLADDRIVDVTTDRGYVRRGTPVFVHAINGTRIVVRPVEGGVA